MVREVGEGVSHLRPGDRVACYGAPFVKHASLLAVPKHLAAPLPPQVSLREASFAVLGAMRRIRRNPEQRIGRCLLHLLQQTENHHRKRKKEQDAENDEQHINGGLML
ncbi:hypothetical protein [Paenibacillus melissococcoides]|uniref:hypothetical protein n=1 Tax=Paenibacillus melissococcoides TaxID=2912268 RepID=UPI0038B3A56D